MQKLGCCRRDRGSSIDTEEDETTMTKMGMFKSWSIDSGSTVTRVDGFCTDSVSLDEENSSCSSSKEPFGSFSARWSMRRPNDEDHIREEALYNMPSPLLCKYDGNCSNGQPLQWEDVEMMKERFAKLLLGEDMSGGSKGVGTALALSNAVTNLSASVFGELWRLEPLAQERKEKWVREMNWLLSPAKYMVELVPARQSYSNGKSIEIMTPRPRSDIQLNLPALRKLDAMLIESLDGIDQKEFSYDDGGSATVDNFGLGRKTGGKKWWLPIPRVPEKGLSDEARKKLLYQRDSVSQIFKAAKSINEQVLSEMAVPDVYWDSLPKTGKASLGDSLYKLITSEHTSIENALSSLNLSTEHGVLETANRLEAAIYTWKRRIQNRHNTNAHVSAEDGRPALIASWSLVRESEAELWKKEHYMERAENTLLHLKNKYPSMPQTFLDITKIQYNKDVGYSILESYSRVLESLAFNILSRINDVLCQDDFAKASKTSPVPPCPALANSEDDGTVTTPPSIIFPSLRKSITWNLDCCRMPSAVSSSSPATSPTHMETPRSQFHSHSDSARLDVMVEEALFSYIRRESCFSESEYKDASDEIISSGRKSSAPVSPRFVNAWCYSTRNSCTNSP